MSAIRKILGNNLADLMRSSADLNSAPAVERATSERGTKVGRSTVDRIKSGETPVNVDFVDVLARVFQKAPWQLLHPTMGKAIERPTVPVALDTLVSAISRLPAADQSDLGENLRKLAESPDSQVAKQRVLEALSPKKTEVNNPAAPEHQEELDRLSKEAEEQHANSAKRRRASGG